MRGKLWGNDYLCWVSNKVSVDGEMGEKVGKKRGG